MNRLENKKVVVTGAASGIGAAVIKSASAEGAVVFAMDVDKVKGQAAANDCDAQFIHCDVSDASSWEQVTETLSEAAGHIDHLHLNAGIQIAPPASRLGEYQFSGMTLPRYRQLMGVNVDGVVLGLHYLLPIMKEGGSIVVTGSLAGISPYGIDPLYSMTKHAITGLVRSLEKEFTERGLRINALCPGAIDTNIIPEDQRTDEAVFMTPDNIAGEVIDLFLTSTSGGAWAKVSDEKPAWLVKAPGQK